MIIIHVITNFSELGGAESALIKLINHTSGKTIKLISLMSKSDHMARRISNPSCEIISLNADSFWTLFLTAFKLKGIFEHYKPSKVFSWMYHANAISAISCILLKTQINLFWGVRHSLDDFQGERASTKIAIYVSKFLNFVPKKVIYCSQKAKIQHEKFGYNIVGKSVYIPNGYDFGNFTPRDYSKEIVNIGAAGRFHSAKDYENFFSAMMILKSYNVNFKLRLCGRGMSFDNPALIEIIHNAGFSLTDVSLLGEISNMDSFYSELDYFVLSSKTEGFPNVLAEAALKGCVIFSTDVGDAPFIVNNSEHIVPVKDPVALAQSIFLFNSKSVEDKGIIASATIKHVHQNFSIHVVSKLFSEL